MMSHDVPGAHCRNRLFEWTMTCALFALGVHLLIWPDAIKASSFRILLNVIGSDSMMAFYLLVGGFRAVALYLNGNWPVWGPQVRALGALAGAVVWLQMDIALAQLAPAVGTPPSPGIPVYTALFIAELYSTYRAAADARLRR
jgi:hypothetical protein